MIGYGLRLQLGSSLMGISGGSLARDGADPHGVYPPGGGDPGCIGVPISLAGTLGYIAAGLPHQALLPPLSIGFVSLIGTLRLVPISSCRTARARLAHALPKRRLEIAFPFLLFAGARFLVSLA